MTDPQPELGLASVTPLRRPAKPRALPAGVVTFLFSDIEGSTGLLHAVGRAGR